MGRGWGADRWPAGCLTIETAKLPTRGQRGVFPLSTHLPLPMAPHPASLSLPVLSLHSPPSSFLLLSFPLPSLLPSFGGPPSYFLHHLHFTPHSSLLAHPPWSLCLLSLWKPLSTSLLLFVSPPQPNSPSSSPSLCLPAWPPELCT